MVWYGTVRYGMVWYGMLWYSTVCRGMVRTLWYGKSKKTDHNRILYTTIVLHSQACQMFYTMSTCLELINANTTSKYFTSNIIYEECN